MTKILLIEDDANIRANVLALLETEGFDARAVESGSAGLALAFVDPPSLVICDVMMPELDGWAVLRALRDHPATANVPFIFLTAKADRSDVRRGMSLGADDYITKPFTRMELLDAVRARLRRVGEGPADRGAPAPSASASAATGPAEDFIVLDPGMHAVYAQATRAAESTISVLILGETGVGKEVLAHAIHRRSRRAEKPFVALNCAALSETLLESELFGHEKGAFTGALAARPGLFEVANGGTVFLDELGEMPPTTQVKLLRVLEDRRVMRVGGRTATAVDVRFVSATNRDLEADAETGRFRADVFFRLNGISVTVPPLRERRAEIVALARSFVVGAARRFGRRTPPTLSDDAARVLERYAWPGNVRELRNVLDRAVVLSDDVILVEHLPPKVVAERAPQDGGRAASGEPAAPAELVRLRGELVALERQRIVAALERCAGNQTQAAEILGISRRTLVARLGEYDLPRPRKR
ncbi:MAG TPA: sigma-54 dependent transcriptional regulator [Byssovorax sp.]|jgi:DNA-binding NtrC family response regulator